MDILNKNFRDDKVLFLKMETTARIAVAFAGTESFGDEFNSKIIIQTERRIFKIWSSFQKESAP